jgi:hypothetical protein
VWQLCRVLQVPDWTVFCMACNIHLANECWYLRWYQLGVPLREGVRGSLVEHYSAAVDCALCWFKLH